MHALVMSSGRADSTKLAVESFRRQHPGVDVTVVDCGPRPSLPSIPGAELISGADLMIGDLRFIDAHLAGGPEFARWAVVPAAVRHIGSATTVLVLPASSWTLQPVADLAEAVDPTQIGLFARRSDPETDLGRDGWMADVAVIGADAAPILEWWTRLAAEAAISEWPSVDLADPWATFVSGGGPVVPIVDPTLRYAADTAGAIELSAGASGPEVGGHPLRLTDLAGVDPARPWWFAPRSARADNAPQVLVSETPALARLIDGYVAELRSIAGPAGERVEPEVPGIVILPTVRRGFRRLLDAARAAGTTAPNPLDPATVGDFIDWLRGPGESGGTGINRAADFVWEMRPDLAHAFPHVRWRDREAAIRWLWTHGLGEGLISPAVLPPLPGPPVATAAPPTPTFGVNLVGYHGAELGLGVAVRRVGAALDAAGIPWGKVSYDRTHSRNQGESTPALAPYWFNLVLVAPDQLDFFVSDVGPEFFADHHNIGLWYWETDVMSDRQRAAFDHVDEVWGATRYLTDVFASHTDKPVVHVPVPLEFSGATDDGARSRLGLDDRFTFLFSFDFLSIVQRKNPLGLVDAYCRAFDIDDGCRLILKSINGDLHLEEIEELRSHLRDRPDIELWDRYLDAPDRIALVREVDCYVSLHRSEGLGLTMAEAMSAGTPVIASGYSGNLDFMDDESALLVDVTVVEIGEGSFYPAHGHWADPDLDHAARLMRQVRDDADLRDRLSTAGPLALRPFTAARVGAAIADRLDQVWRRSQSSCAEGP